MARHRGRGACSSPAPRYLAHSHHPHPDPDTPEAWSRPQTRVSTQRIGQVISYNQSPDLPFDRSINPYRGCEHGCIYCFARPSHAWLDLSPGLDFETRIIARPDAPRRLAEILRSPRYECRPIVIGTNTDCYQPIEKRLGITRNLLEVLAEHRHPVSLLTKSNLVQRDMDLLAEMAKDGLASVMVSVTTLDSELKRRLEPRTPSGARRLDTVRALSEAGIPTGVLLAPVIPALNDHEIEAIARVSAEAGASSLSWVLLRLPHEVAPLFRDWLAEHYPDRAGKIMGMIQASRGGRDYDHRWGRRLRGEGPFAELLARRIQLACRRHGLDHDTRPRLETGLFRVPGRSGDQFTLFPQPAGSDSSLNSSGPNQK